MKVFAAAAVSLLLFLMGLPLVMTGAIFLFSPGSSGLPYFMPPAFVLLGVLLLALAFLGTWWAVVGSRK